MKCFRTMTKILYVPQLLCMQSVHRLLDGQIDLKTFVQVRIISSVYNYNLLGNDYFN